MRNSVIIKMLQQSVSIMILAVITGVFFNYVRREGIPFFIRSKNLDLGISIDQAKRLFYSKNAIFIDARPYEFYKKLHIKGAINIPLGEEEKIKKMDIPKDKIIITYCDDEKCALSKELAMELYVLGYDNVYYIKDGLRVWISHNLPVERGK